MVKIVENIKLESAFKKMPTAEHGAIWTTPGNAVGELPLCLKVWGRVTIATRVLRLGNGKYSLVLDGANSPTDELFNLRNPLEMSFSEPSEIRENYPPLFEANGTLFMW